MTNDSSAKQNTNAGLPPLTPPSPGPTAIQSSPPSSSPQRQSPPLPSSPPPSSPKAATSSAPFTPPPQQDIPFETPPSSTPPAFTPQAISQSPSPAPEAGSSIFSPQPPISSPSLFKQAPPFSPPSPSQPAPGAWSPPTVQQSMLIEGEGEEELFGREKLSLTQKTIILIISLLALLIIGGAGFWLYISLNRTTSSTVLSQDSDADGLSDAEEQRWKTDPKKADSDGDGYLDGEEVKHGYNPLGK